MLAIITKDAIVLSYFCAKAFEKRQKYYKIMRNNIPKLLTLKIKANFRDRQVEAVFLA